MTTAPLVWPRTVKFPSPDVAIVYLDLNHWIRLAQTATGHSEGRAFVQVLDSCRRARETGAAVFVLAATHYFEMLKIKDPAQRRAVADVMEDLTQFATLLSRPIIMRLELNAMLDTLGYAPIQQAAIDLVGTGVRHAFGRQTGLKIMGPSGDETEAVRERVGHEKFDDIIAKANLMLERGILRGPADDEVDHMRSLGWSPETVMEVAENRAAEERAQSVRLDEEGGRWRRGRLRDVVSARELYIELNASLADVLTERQVSATDVFSDLQAARALMSAMPSTEVAVELKTAWHRNRDKAWTANDICDIDAMSLAVPYCDVVVTEKACHHALQTAGVGTRMNTVLLRDLQALPETIASSTPTRPADPK